MKTIPFEIILPPCFLYFQLLKVPKWCFHELFWCDWTTFNATHGISYHDIPFENTYNIWYSHFWWYRI